MALGGSGAFQRVARTSSGADHHRIVVVTALGHIKNDHDDYLGTGQPLKTDDDLNAFAARYLYRVKGDWFIGGQGTAANDQVLGARSQRQARDRCKVTLHHRFAGLYDRDDLPI